MVDALKNFAYSLVATAPSPATSGTSLVVTAGQGSYFPTAPFDATLWPAGSYPNNTNAEIVRVTNVSTDTFTITRAQYGTTAQSIASGYNIAQTVDANLIGQLAALSGATFTGEVVAPDFKVTGLTGANAVTSRFVGSTANGAPVSGTFAVGDFIVDQTATIERLPLVTLSLTKLQQFGFALPPVLPVLGGLSLKHTWSVVQQPQQQGQTK